MDDELLDLVDANDQVIGEVYRSKSASITPESGTFIRCVSAFIQRDNGDLWIPTRSLEKRIAPGGLDFSSGGFVGKGESYEQAVLREVREESGLTLDRAAVRLIEKHMLLGTPNFFESFYVIKSNTEPVLGVEHTSANWMSAADLRAALEAGVAAKTSLLLDVKLLQSLDVAADVTTEEK